ncbi:MAG: hypothetical protein JXJ18_06430 [Rhodobacteraceae bacterium]|nr:hypothetical protein [Paracoccaceae bacterium]
MTRLADLDARIWQAILAGAFVAFGWLVNGWQNRREAAALRAERLRDAHRALFAEIASNLANLRSVEALTGYRDDLIARMRADPGYVPLIPRERNDTIFRALIAEIHILPRVTIDPIVSYYNQLFALEALIEDMRGERFKTLEQERRIAMYSDYIDLKTQALNDGQYALRMIAAYAKGGPAAALQEEARAAQEPGADALSTPDVDPSGRSQG